MDDFAWMTNTVHLDAGPGDTNAANNADTLVTEVALFDLSITKSGPPGVLTNYVFSYDLIVSNLGLGVVSDLVITDTLPPSVSFISASPGCVYSNGEVICSEARINPGQVASFSIQVRSPPHIDEFTNHVAILPLAGDRNLDNNVASQATFVTTDFVVAGTSPGNGDLSNNRHLITVHFSDALDVTSIDSTSIIVHGNQRGIYTGQFVFPRANQLSFFANEPFFHGEQLEVSILEDVLSTRGETVVPYAFTFTMGSLGCENLAYELEESYSIGNSRNVQLGDMNGDGSLDAVFVNDTGLVRIRLNNGQGSLDSHIDLPGTTMALDLALGDMDGDGDLDIVLADYNSDNSIFLNDGAGGFV
ncbi:MAG: FG-GAP-like repeat-containing protein, partial [Verrucomicrobiota bacterium]